MTGVPDDRLQDLMHAKDQLAAAEACVKYGYSEFWTITDDGCLVIYNGDSPPAWLPNRESE